MAKYKSNYTGQQIDRSVFYDTFGYVPDPTLYHKPEDKHDD